MRTIIVYKFDELSDEAKKRAMDELRTKIGSHLCEIDSYDFSDSLTAFSKMLGLKCEADTDHGTIFATAKWSDQYGCEQGNEFWTPDKGWTMVYLREYCGRVLYRWINNNIEFKKRKNYYKWHSDRTYKKRRSRIMWDENEGFELTGVYSDYGLLAPFREFMQNPDKSTTLEDLVDDALMRFCRNWNDAIYHNYDDETIADKIENYNYEFTEDGVIL